MNDTNAASLPKDVNQENKKRLHLLILCIFSILITGIVLYGCYTSAYTYKDSRDLISCNVYHVIFYELKDNIQYLAEDEIFLYSMALLAFSASVVLSILNIIFTGWSLINPKKKPFKNTFLIAAISCYTAMYLTLNYVYQYHVEPLSPYIYFTPTKTPYIIFALSILFYFYQTSLKVFKNQQYLEKNRVISSLFLNSASLLIVISMFLTFTNVMCYSQKVDSIFGGGTDKYYVNIGFALYAKNYDIYKAFEGGFYGLLSFDYCFYFFAVLLAAFGAFQTFLEPTDKKLWKRLSFYIGAGCLVLYHLFLIICILNNIQNDILVIHYQAVVAFSLSIVALTLYLVGDLVFKRKIKEIPVDLQ